MCFLWFTQSASSKQSLCAADLFQTVNELMVEKQKSKACLDQNKLSSMRAKRTKHKRLFGSDEVKQSLMHCNLKIIMWPPTIDCSHCANNIILEQSRLRSLHRPEEQCPHYATDAQPVSAALWEAACRPAGGLGGGVMVVVVESRRLITDFKVTCLRVCGFPEHPRRPDEARSHDGGRGQAVLPEGAVSLAHLRLRLLRSEGERESRQPLRPPRPAIVVCGGPADGWAGCLISRAL